MFCISYGPVKGVGGGAVKVQSYLRRLSGRRMISDDTCCLRTTTHSVLPHRFIVFHVSENDNDDQCRPETRYLCHDRESRSGTSNTPW